MTPVKKQIKMQTLHKDAWWQTRKIIVGSEALVWCVIWDQMKDKM